MTPKVLVVGMDGLRFDRLLAADPPVLRGLMESGAYGTSLLPYGKHRAKRTERPGAVVAEPGRDPITARTDSGPGWSSIATGVWPDKHGVVDNGFAGADYTKYPSFLSRAQEAGHTTFAIVSWDLLGVHGTFAESLHARIVLDGERDGYVVLDAGVAETAARVLADEGPDASFVYFGGTDEIAHEQGPLCDDYQAAILSQDAQLGLLLEAVRGRGTYADESWTVIVTTDHGHLDKGGHGGDTDEERGTFVIVSPCAASFGAPPRLVDVAPTALAVLGVPIDPAWNLDGTPLTAR
ncbi:alkaline phosphatase family protein [Streptosporangiaceae bacterium NEAU-GS5]|nr:alkaline phosphatase family protein [Streptosporangiaceae bacterium NEAU-GS5]